MHPKLNMFTLEITRIDKTIIDDYHKKFNDNVYRKLFIGTFIFTAIYNIGFVLLTTLMSENESFGGKFISTLIPDLVSIISILIFFGLFPKQNIYFSGISCIPMIVTIIFQIEFNIRVYEYESIHH